jgi:hypothetical protein
VSAPSEDDRASFPVSIATPSTQSYSTSIHDSRGAQISSGSEEKTVSRVPLFLLTHMDVLHFSLYKGNVYEISENIQTWFNSVMDLYT